MGALLVALGGCSPFYVMRAAYEEGKILLNRKAIAAAIESPQTPEDERQKLRLVLEARDFATEMGLTPGASFTKYTHVDKDTLAWVLVASKPDSFSLHTWWFPIVGRVPYKGFFERSDADAAATKLEHRGYESWVRGTEAISTLGWFNDPVLSTTLRHEPMRIVNTVIHETLHATVWIPNQVEFNESLANFVGGKGMAQFYSAKLRSCKENCAEASTAAQSACRALQSDMQVAQSVEALYTELNALYSGSATREEKLSLREEVFARHTEALRGAFPKMTALKKINNAELIQLKLYMTKLMYFEALYQKLGGSWAPFLLAMRDIANAVGKDASKDPFELVAQQVAGTAAPINGELCR
jgi:predicted aminopeptidase